ncbi:right-handed parallel beta-helix repeat-containing protein [Pseudofrankia inefficax]|uniref:Right handed beta helix domain-containing protein n=1 Tax=Pseudofrankia inefficax (strain DSM 45817 / CECT 9037 / DDB 130130 / EuI1c) TaxID=298654 RepID=E3J4U9_PSEI1|nr:right-handed parallel beta-helix repeat-containing protein [Pseudofrankia inefficax]ADP78268.1 hypothetical protein FraEuI1c_0180 [Pseudofrankia inefficax]
MGAPADTTTTTWGFPARRRPRALAALTAGLAAAAVLLAACGGGHGTPAAPGTLEQGVPTAAPTGNLATYPAPDTPYVVGAGQRYTSIQKAVDAAPEGATIYIKNGTYRESVIPKSGQTLQGESRDGTRIDGANAVTASSWHRDGRLWYFTDPWPLRGKVAALWDGVTPDIDALDTDLLHRDDVPLLHKAQRGQVGSGDFWIDYDSHRVYIADDPAGHRFELAVRRVGVGDTNGTATNVNLVNLTVEKTATGFNEAGIEMKTGWTIKDCLVLGHHGRGINTEIDNTIVGTIAPTTGSYSGSGDQASDQQGRSGSMQVLLNGDLGIGGDPHLDAAPNGNNIQITNTEIGWSNVERYSYWDEAGGVKLSGRSNVSLSGDWIHDSYGAGTWFDTGNKNIKVTGSLFEDNLAAGVWYEANDGGIEITKNTFRRNGDTDLAMNRQFDTRGQYSAIFLSDSANATVDQNFIQVGTHGGFGIASHYGGRIHPAHYAINGNVISIGIPTAAFAFGSDGTDIVFTDNSVLTWGQVTPTSNLFSLGAGSFTAWQASGRDTHGIIAAVAVPPAS